MSPAQAGIIIAVGGLLLTLFFSLAVHALRFANWIRLEDAFDELEKPHRFVRLRTHFERFLSTMEILRLTCNLTVVCSLVYALSSPDGGMGVWVFVKGCLMAVALLSLFAVAIPNAWARYGGTGVLVRGYLPIRAFEILLRPLIAVLHLVYLVARQFAGIGEDDEDKNDQRQEQLLSVMEEGEKRGVVDEEEKEMIVSVLEFRETTAGEIMTPRTDVAGIPVNAALAQVIDLVAQTCFSRYPVYDQSIDHIVAILYTKDLISYLGKPDDPFDMNRLLRKPLFVPESKCLRDLLHDFQNQKVHIAVVLDEYGGTAGVVTFEDILEELVGDITDEHEPLRQAMLKRIDDRTFELDARFSVDELNYEYDLELPEDEDYETVGGFIFSQLGHIPRTGETFVYENLRFTVLSAQARKIERVRLDILPDEPEPA